MTLDSRKKKALGIALHLLAWTVLFSFPFLYSGNEFVNNEFLIRTSWLPLLWSAILFYVNYLFLLNHFLFNRKTVAFICINILLIAIFALLNNLVMDLMPRPEPNFPMFPPQGKHFEPSKFPFFLRSAASFFIPVITSLSIKTTQRWLKTETVMKEIDNQRLASELTHLKYQLQPHFFFNSLNSIYSLIDTSQEKAKQGVHSLGKMMRYLLYETTSPKVSLAKEIEFLQQYINVMKLRMRDDVKVNTSFPEELPAWQIAPLLFIPLIENAFKHGISSSKPSFVHVELLLDNGTVILSVENTYYPKSNEDQSGSGIGLENLRKRLDMQYAKKYVLRQEILHEIFCTKLTIKTC
jgi:two-component sensor histidine kinase